MFILNKIKRGMSLLWGQFKVLLVDGPKGNVDDIKNFSQLWSLDGVAIADQGGSSSISDTAGYNSICKLASTDDEFFRKFKSNREYREILQHVTRNQGKEYLAELKKDSWIMSHLPALLDDKVGMPFRYTYPRLGRVSPTDLRYARVLSDLYYLFGPLENFKIAEIGSGYGGQALAITKIFRVSSYTFYDLPSAAELALKYIRNSSDFQRCYLGGIDKVPENFDLVISNYAFSELRLEIQENYFSRVIQSSARGYIIYNHISPPSFNSLTAKEFAARIPGAEIFQEIPLTSPANVLIVWGHNPISDGHRFVGV